MEHELVKPFIVKASKERDTHVPNRHAASATTAHPILHLQRTIGNRAVARLLQTKLEVSHPSDFYEQEAEDVAHRLSAMPAPGPQPAVQRQTASEKEEEKEKEHQGVQRKPLAGSIHSLAQREVNPDEDKDKDKKTLQRATSPESDHDESNGVPHADKAVSASTSTGQPLPSNLQRKFEQGLGADLSAVRVHTGPESVEANKAISARAYTTGSDIHFNKGQYDPGSLEGQHLLAHEAVHTVQQSGAAPHQDDEVGGMQVLAPQVQRQDDGRTDDQQHEADAEPDMGGPMVVKEDFEPKEFEQRPDEDLEIREVGDFPEQNPDEKGNCSTARIFGCRPHRNRCVRRP